MYSACGNHSIRAVEPGDGGVPRRRRDFGDVAKVGNDLGDLIARKPEFGGKCALNFGNDLFGNNDVVLGDERLKKVRAQAARRERGDDHVGIEGDPHARARKTSSSVR